MRRPSIQLSAWIAKRAREGGLEIHNTPFEPWEGTTIVNSKTDASLDQAFLHSELRGQLPGIWRRYYYPLRRSGQNSANEGCSPSVLSIA
jgi:hypothetical protein